MSTDRKMNTPTKPKWHELAEQATREDDGEKLCRLVEEICDTIDAAQAAKKRRLVGPQPGAQGKAVERPKP